MSYFKSLAFASLLFAAPLWAQVTYTDIEPDVTLTEWDAHFLRIGPDADDGLYIWKHPNEVVVNSMVSSVQVLFDGDYPAAVEYGQTISSSAAWMKPNYAVLNHEGATGHWIGVEDRYLGLRYKEGSDWHYAWARLDIDAAPSHFTLKDFAVETGAGTPIFAGAEGSADVNESADQKLYTLRGHQLTLGSDATVSVSSILGDQILEGQFGNGESIDLAKLGKGCMFIRINASGNTASIKLVVGNN
jgi:hypothetical protein